MRKINKNPSPAWFEKWKNDFFTDNNREPSYEDLDTESRIRLRDELVKEQGYICCYCMRRIFLNGSRTEHFKPRGSFKDEELNYNNMFASCDGNENSVVISMQHCDLRKWNWYDDGMPSLLDSAIEQCVNYRIDGTVLPFHNKGNRHAVEKSIIENLGLNAPYLVRNRRKTYEHSELMDDVEYSKDDWIGFIRFYDTLHEGKYEEYCMALIRLMMVYAD